MSRRTKGTLAALAALGAVALGSAAPAAATDRDPAASSAVREAQNLIASRSGRAARASTRGYGGRRTRFTAEQNVFLESAIALDDLQTPGRANATVPAFRGVGPDGKDDVWYIITEAADFEVADILGVNYAPKLVFGRGTDGSQEVTLDRGRLRFRGAVDFRPERVVTPGTGPSAFPPA